MKILTLFAQHHWTGPAEPELAKLSELQKLGHEVVFCFTRRPAGTLKKVVQSLNIKSIEEVTLYRKRPAPFLFLKDLNALKDFFESSPPDILHCHHSHDHWTGIALREKLKQKPVFIRSLHESRKLKKSSSDQWLHNRTDGFFVPSAGFAKKMKQSFGINDNRIEVVPGIVDPQRFTPGLESSAFLEEINASSDAPLLGIVSRIKPGRGHDNLFSAFRSLMDDYPKARLVVVGRGEGMDSLMKANQDLVDHGRAHFTGYRKDDLPNILNALRVKILLGEGSDGTCRAVLEAMACETPVIAADLGVLPETVDHERTGLVVKPDDVKSLEDAMRFALEKPEKILKMGKEARLDILQKHTVEKAAAKVEAFYQKLISKKNR